MMIASVYCIVMSCSLFFLLDPNYLNNSGKAPCPSMPMSVYEEFHLKPVICIVIALKIYVLHIFFYVIFQSTFRKVIDFCYADH